MKSGDIIALGIDGIAFGGAGIGRHKVDERDFVVFVDEAVPGDKIRVKIGSKKRNHAIGYIEDFIKRSEKRIKPRCKHFGSCGDKCGGCSLQYLSYNDQLLIKEQHVKDAVSRIGGFNPDLVAQILGCDDMWCYRNKMEFSFSRDSNGTLSLGLHVKRRHHDLVELTECFLFSPYIGQFITEMRLLFRSIDISGLFSKGCKPVSLVVREGKNTGEIMVNLITENGSASFPDDFKNKVKKFFIKRGDLKSIYHTNIKNILGSPKKINEKLIWGDPVIVEKMKISPNIELQYEIKPQSFFQPNTLQAQKLYKLALDFAQLEGNETVYDLYCGTGTISLAFAKRAAHVYGIDINKSAISNAQSNSRRNHILNVDFFEGDVKKKIFELDKKPDIVIVDPPRSGLEPLLIDKISQLSPKKIIYISCNPSTLARDLNLFSKTGYTLKSVQPVDMFPQTYHIESVSLLAR